jgi:ubiquinone/menaquinone biosynthesis C-methylase UbiE
MDIDYTDISRNYDEYRSFPEELLRRVVELGGIEAGTAVLEVGCGTGNAAASLRELCRANATGIDRSPAMLKIAAAKGVPVICADADGKSFPLRSSTFDAVIGIYVIHQIQDLEGLFAECHRVIEGGAIVLLTSSHSQISDQHPAIKQFFPSFVSIDVGRFPDLPAVGDALSRAGFEAIEHGEIAIRRTPLDEAFLEKVRNKYISTYELIPQEEFRAGVQGLEAYIRGLKAPEFREWRATLIKANKPRS